MDSDDNTLDEAIEIGSDELLADDSLRLPESASILVRLHAVRAWLTRRCEEVHMQIGAAALDIQIAMQDETQEARPRRRERQNQAVYLLPIQLRLAEAQQRLEAYEEAQSLLEECVAHTNGERVLVEYYLALDERVQSLTEEHLNPSEQEHNPLLQALADVQHRVEHVCVPSEEDL